MINKGPQHFADIGPIAEVELARGFGDRISDLSERIVGAVRNIFPANLASVCENVIEHAFSEDGPLVVGYESYFLECVVNIVWPVRAALNDLAGTTKT